MQKNINTASPSVTAHHISYDTNTPQAPPTLLQVNNLDAIDGSLQKKLKKGKIPIDKTTDLHGLTAEQAKIQTEQSIIHSYHQHHRLLLIITGKGKGILQKELALWVNQPSIKQYIRVFKQAPQHHGGTGAFYIYLKKIGSNIFYRPKKSRI